MDRDGLFLEVPLLPAGEDGIAQAEKLAGIPLRPKLRGPVPAGVIPGVPGGAFVSATGGDPAEALHAAYAQAKRQETEQEREAAARLVEWDKLQTWIGSAVRHWFAAMPAEQRQRFDPRLLERYPPEADTTPEVAHHRLLADLNALTNTLMMSGSFRVGGDYRIGVVPDYLTGTLVAQLLDALQQDRAYRICDHCGRPFAYKSERAVYCGQSCKTLAWRKRKAEEGDK